MKITAYFKYPSPEAAQNALVRIKEIKLYNTAFDLIWGWKENGSPKVVEVTFFNPAGTDPHPYEFPYFCDVEAIARATGAIKVFRNYHEIWPNQKRQV